MRAMMSESGITERRAPMSRAVEEARRILAITEPGDGWGAPYYIGHVELAGMGYAGGGVDMVLAEALATVVDMSVDALPGYLARCREEA